MVPLLKFSGWDALEIQGKAEKDLIVFIDGNEGIIQFEDGEEYPEDSHLLAEELTTKYAVDEDDKVNVSVVSSGSAAKHTLMGMLNFSFYDPRRKTVRFKQAARGGIGTILREKRIKAWWLNTRALRATSTTLPIWARSTRLGSSITNRCTTSTTNKTKCARSEPPTP